jgi:hypothetical protein
MSSAGSTRQGQRQHPWWCPLAARHAALAAILAALMVLSGCQSPGGDKTAKAEPLFGETDPGRPAIGPTPPPQNRAGMKGTAPTTPTTTAANSSTQALLLSTEQVLPGKNPLRITDPNQPNAQTVGGWQKPGELPAAVVPNPPVKINGIETPAVQPVPPPTVLMPVPSVTINPVAAVDTDQLLAALKAKGMVWNGKQDVPGGGVRFSCYVANPQDPNAVQAYDATAPDLASAMQAVLQKINAQ